MKLVFTVLLCFIFSVGIGQNVGIGTSTPTEKLNIDSGHLKLGNAIWTADSTARLLKFGDADFVTIGEAGGDDVMRLTARNFVFEPSIGATVPFVEFQGGLMIADGTEASGRILTSDGTGRTSWQNPANANSGFSANFTGTVPVTSSVSLPVNWAVEQYDDGSDLSGSTFTTTKPGLYHFNINLTFALAGIVNSGTHVGILATLPGGKERYAYVPVSSANNGGRATASLSFDIKLAAGETIGVSAIQNTGVTQNIISEIASNKDASIFTGHRIY